MLLAADGLAAPGDLRWSTNVSGQAWANPTVAPDGTMYIGTHHTGGVLYAVAPTGTILRQVFTPGTMEHSPALDADGNLYLATLFGALAPGNTNPSGPWIISYEATNFNQRWRTRLSNGSDNSPWFGPAGKLYTGLVADPRSPTATNGQHFYRFDQASGTTQLDMAVEGWVACPGVVDEVGRVFFGAEDITGDPATVNSSVWPGVFYAMDANDAIQWTKYTATGGDFGSPVSTVGGIVYTTCRDKNLYGFRATDGEIVFQRPLAGRSWTGCTIGVNTNTGNWVLYTGTQGTNEGSGLGVLYAIELDGTSTGRLLWATNVAPMTFGNVALDDRGNLYYTTSVGELAARSADGALLWSTNCGGGAGGPTILNDGTIVVGSTANRIMAFEGSGNHLADNVPWPKYKRNLRNTSYVLDPVRDLPATNRVAFVVDSEVGTPFPWAGTNYYPTGTVIWAQAPDWKNRNTQFVCVGWTDGTGDAPPTGSTNRLSFTLTTNSALRWLWTTNYSFSAAHTSIPIYVTIVMHSEQGARYDQLPALFETARTNVYLFASLLAQRGVQFDFQSDWTFLAGVTNYDTAGRPETGGTNIVKWMERDLGFAIDPHNHVGESIYNYADVAALIALCGATPTPVAGGFIAFPVTNSEWELFQQTITGAVYTATTWTPGALWGAGSANHSLDTNLWFSGVYCPRDGTNYWQHQDGNLPEIGGYGGRYQIWTNLDMLLSLRDAGLLCTGSLYTCNQMVNMGSLNTAYITNFDAQLQIHTNKPNLHWVNLVQLTNIWAVHYNRRPSRLPWATTNDLDADGIVDGWEVTNFCGTCESDGASDTDADDWTDLEEFIADTQPTNAASGFSNDWNLADPAFPILGIPASSDGRQYGVESATNLLDGVWTRIRSGIPGNGGYLMIGLTNEQPVEAYRAIVERP
jgi:hypothetical protein